MQDELNFEGVEKQPLRTFTEKAYLDYSMYVIRPRAAVTLGRTLRAAPHHLRHEELSASRPDRSTRNPRVPSVTRIASSIAAIRPAEAMVLGAGLQLSISNRRWQGNWVRPTSPSRLRPCGTPRQADDSRGVAPELGWHRRLAAQLRWHAGGTAFLPARLQTYFSTVPGHRRWNVDGHSAAQSS
jgi:hypothetical protein